LGPESLKDAPAIGWFGRQEMPPHLDRGEKLS
jgi:hypothetical protein